MPTRVDIGELAAGVRTGDRRSIARAISIVEDRRPHADALLAELFEGPPRANVVGVTGSPGAGKSSLVSELIGHLRAEGLSVAVLAVDPSSPLTGGAILGDRIRMQHHVNDEAVYVRSMSTRGHLGGLSDSTSRAIVVLGAAGFDVIIIETVGVGQSETEIAHAADTTVVVVTPGWGDGIQAAKAGLLEIADVFVVNKSDLGGVELVARDLTLMLELGTPSDWTVPIIPVSSVNGTGIGDLWHAIEDHRSWLDEDGDGTRKRREQLDVIIRGAVRAEMISAVARLDVPGAVSDRVFLGKTDPWSAARAIVSRSRSRVS